MVARKAHNLQVVSSSLTLATMPYKDKDDQKKCAAQHYLDNKDLYKARANIQKVASRLRNAQYIYDYLLVHPCECGENDPVVLQFDHRDGENKVSNIATAVNKPWSLKRLKEEISKCTVRCANCHLRRTARQMNWYVKLKII